MKFIKGFAFLFLMLWQLTGNTSFALPFNVVPNGPLPTTIEIGETISASYMVTNNTSVTSFNSFVKYLPPNVSQDTTGPGACGSTFTLAPGQSCQLNLIVSGPVDGNDPDPHHHLFVCFSGGLTCAGTRSPLNVAQNSGILYGVTGENGSTQHTLFSIDKTTGFATQIMTLTQSACCGHIIASDGMSLYHWNGHDNPNQIFEKIDLQSQTLTPIPLTGSGIDEPNGAVFYNGAFLYTDSDANISSVTTTGFATFIGSMLDNARGLACFNNHVYGVDPFDPNLFEINPANGSFISTTPITMPGFTVEGAVGLTVDRGTGIFYALIKVSSQNVRKLATINVQTGVATEIGDANNGTDLRFSSIAFNPTSTC